MNRIGWAGGLGEVLALGEMPEEADPQVLGCDQPMHVFRSESECVALRILIDVVEDHV